MNTNTNYFVELAKINVNEHIERKGQFSYLSWPFAVEKLRQFDPAATWQVQRFDGLPYRCFNSRFSTICACSRALSRLALTPVSLLINGLISASILAEGCVWLLRLMGGNIKRPDKRHWMVDESKH